MSDTASINNAQPQKEISKAASFWFGEEIPRKASSSVLPNAPSSRILMSRILSIVSITLGVIAGLLFIFSSYRHSPKDHVKSAIDLLYDTLIPALAIISFLLASTVAFRSFLSYFMSSASPSSVEKTQRIAFVAGASVLFAFSCAYRALNIADEGAAACRGPPSAFNAPAAGRTVATIGEVSLVIQISIFIIHQADALKVNHYLSSYLFKKITNIPLTTIGPVIVAELASWSGVLSGQSKFYCLEYVLWMIIALSWSWDGALLLSASTKFSDKLVYFFLMFGGLALFFFNAFFEIPHFFTYTRDPTTQNSLPTGIWECYQHRDSPLWLKRLPFFFCYFIGCSWCSVALTYRFIKINKYKKN